MVIGEKMSEQKKSKNKQETVKVIFAKNAETVDFGKYHLLYDGGKFKYNPDKDFSCRKQLSNNCGVFIINAELDDEIENQDENDINISQIPENQRKKCIKMINSLINYYNVISGDEISKIKIEEKNTENKKAENKNVENKNVEIPIPTFAFNIANIFEVVARAAIKNAIKNSENTGWEVLNGNDNEHEVLKENNDDFYINGSVKPDIIIRKKVEENTYKYIIIDAKYKSPENKNRMDRLQILAYAYLYDAHIVGHIFPKKSKKTNKEFRFDINTIFNKSLDKNSSDKYKYVELYLDDKNFENNLSDIINPGNENEKSNN